MNYMPYNNNRNYLANNGINWVNGLEGAKAWQLAPNSNAALLDSENDGVFYIKTSDNIGMCNIRTFKYTEVVEKRPEYVTKEELQKMMEEIREELHEQFIPTVESGRTESQYYANNERIQEWNESGYIDQTVDPTESESQGSFGYGRDGQGKSKGFIFSKGKRDEHRPRSGS